MLYSFQSLASDFTQTITTKGDVYPLSPAFSLELFHSVEFVSCTYDKYFDAISNIGEVCFENRVS